MTGSNSLPPRPIFGLTSFVLGAFALLLVLTQFSAGPFAPQQRVGVTIGEIAADIRQSAVRKLKGLAQPEPVAEPWNIDKVLKLVASVLGVLALVAGGAGFIMREDRRPAYTGCLLGAGAIAFQLFTWVVLMVLGTILLVAIIQNIGGILGDAVGP